MDDHAAVLKVWSKRCRDLGRARTLVACRLHQVLCELIPGGVPGEITAVQAERILASITPSEEVEAARWELAAELTEDLRGTGARIRETKKKTAAAVRAAGTSVTGLFGIGPVIAAVVIGYVRHVARFPEPGPPSRLQRHRTDRGVLRRPQDVAAVPARQPQAQPRHPPGRDHPDPLTGSLGSQPMHRRTSAHPSHRQAATGSTSAATPAPGPSPRLGSRRPSRRNDTAVIAGRPLAADRRHTPVADGHRPSRTAPVRSALEVQAG
jgi:hypothetical protein